MLGDRRNARREAARQPHQNVFDRRRAFVLGRKHLWVIGIKLECGLAALLFTEAEEPLDRRMAMGAVLPLAGRAPLELRCLRGIRERLAGGDQCRDVYAIIDSDIRVSHSFLHNYSR